MQTKKIFFHLFAFLSFPGLAVAATYYVRPDGHDGASGANNSASASNGAWLTLQHAADKMVAGDNVMVADGTYVGFFVETAGKPSAPITYKSIGTGANITSRNSRTADGINIESWTGTPADYITIDGFNVSGQTRMGVRAIAGTGITVKNTVSHDNADCGIFTGGTPNFSILNTVTYNNGSTLYQHNIYISNADSDNPVVRGNVAYAAGGGNGIQLNGDWQEGGDGYIDNALVEDNIVYDNAAKAFSLISVRYATVRNNITYGNSGAGGIHIVEQLAQNYSTGNTVVNNTLDETGTACVRINANNTANVVFNNICIGATGIVFEGTGNYQSNNYAASTAGANIFVGYSSHDYHLLATSPARDCGIATFQSKTAPNVDFESRTRPLGTGYDAGAYEYHPAGGVVSPAAPARLGVE